MCGEVCYTVPEREYVNARSLDLPFPFESWIPEATHTYSSWVGCKVDPGGVQARHGRGIYIVFKAMCYKLRGSWSAFAKEHKLTC